MRKVYGTKSSVKEATHKRGSFYEVRPEEVPSDRPSDIKREYESSRIMNGEKFLFFTTEPL